MSLLKRVMAAALACSIGLAGSFAPALACGPFFDEAMFSYTAHPDLPLKLYADGDLGLVEPTFARSYLVVAYRYFIGKPLSVVEKEQAVNFWRFRLSNNSYDDSYAAVNNWLSERKKAMAGLSTLEKIDRIDAYRESGGPDDYSPFLNCTDGSFKQAVKTLREKVAQFGAGSPQVQDWLSAQDKVFCHCSAPAYNYTTKTSAKEPPFPAAAPASATVQERCERAYQIAAANFYAKNYDEAIKLFSAIADDSASPYQKIAPYLVCRCLVRKATVLSKSVDVATLQAAQSKLQALQKEPLSAELKEGVEGLLKFISLRLDPDAAVSALSKRLAEGSDTFYQDLDGYVYLLDSAFKESSEDSTTTHKVDNAKLAQALHADAMTDWIWTFSSDDKDSLQHAGDRYNETKGKNDNSATAWLICIASKLNGKEPLTAEVLTALSAVNPTHAAYTSAAYQRARLLAATGKGAEAIAVVDAALSGVKAPSSVNKLNSIKMNVASSIDQFMTLAYQSPAIVFAESEQSALAEQWDKADKQKQTGYSTSSPLLRFDAAYTINQRMPLNLLVQAAQSARVPAAQRRDLAQALFCRAVLLRDQAAATKASELLKKTMPSLVPLLKSYDAGSKEFGAAFIMLKNPGMRPTVTGGVGRTTDIGRIDDYQDNWWGAIKANKDDDRAAPVNSPVPPFITAADLKTASADVAAINALGTGADYLGKIVLNYARTNGGDPRVPEALHIVVKSTKFSYSYDHKSDTSKQAFQMLHQKYKGNPWATKTPFYY